MPADAALVQRDPALRGLGIVLDPDAVLTMWSACVLRDVELLDARATYVRYKPATSCVVGYELATSQGPVLAFAKVLAAGASPKLAKSRQRAVRDEGTGIGVLVDEARRVVLAPATSDRDLPALRAIADPPRRERLLRALLPGHAELWDHSIRPLRHRPERRWLGVVDDGSRPVALIKAYRPPDFAPARSRHAVLAPDRPLRWSRRRAVLASTWIHGTSLATTLSGGGAVDLEPVGAALVRLHAEAPAAVFADGGARAIGATLPPALAAIAAVLPAAAGVARRVADTAGPALTGGARRVTHGDFSADQVVIDDGVVHLIDFDHAQLADPVADLASFQADLIRAELEGRLGATTAAELGDELVATYRRVGGSVDQRRLAHHRAGALLRLAVAPFRQRLPDWTERGAALVQRAEACLAPHAPNAATR